MNRVESERISREGKPLYPLHSYNLWYIMISFRVYMVVQVMSTAFKIVLGLVQVVSKQPEVLKEDYPGLMWDSEWLTVFSFGENIVQQQAHDCSFAVDSSD